jgi:hypothetical protein
MAIVTSIVGKSGSGKSHSYQTLKNKDEVFIIRPSKKPFPFKGGIFSAWNKETKKGHYVYTDDAGFVIAAMKKMTEENGKKIIIIEDSTFIMTNYFMQTALETGYTKFTVNALNYFNIIKAAEDLGEDVRVYLINHIEDGSDGYQKVKTIGKLLDDKIDIPSLLTVVLSASVVDGKHVFQTNKRSNMDIAKSPVGMFEKEYIPNDLQVVDDAIKEYYLPE